MIDAILYTVKKKYLLNKKNVRNVTKTEMQNTQKNSRK